MGLIRGMLRFGIIGALALGGAALLLPDGTVHSVMGKARAAAEDVVGKCTDDPIVLRRQLESLAAEYPERIAEVRGEIAEIDHQNKEFVREIDIAKRVVAMATDDLQSLQALVSRAESENAGSRAVFIRYEGARFDIDEAYSEGRRINSVRTAYADRLAHGEVQMKFLGEQRSRLSDILTKLEDEFTTYQSQLWQLEREIDAIERNDRLIELTKEQQATLDSFERFGKVKNLGQVEAKLAELRARQEAQLQSLATTSIHSDYEDRVMFEIEARQFEESNPFELHEVESEEISKVDRDDLALLGPVIIELP